MMTYTASRERSYKKF